MELIIRKRLLEHKDKLSLLQVNLDEELKKPHRERNGRLLDFLYKEKSVYQFAVQELEDLLVK